MIKYRGYAAECDTLEELITAINRLPDTIDYIKVQRSLQHFQPPSTVLKWSKNLGEKSKEIINKALEEEDFWGKVNKFYLNSYYGEGKKDHPYYVNLDSDKSRDFGNKMRNGKFGSLD
jgi:hypothetical protein